MINSFRGRWCFLSNFHPCEITYQGIKYPSVEHYYVSMKVKNDQQINGRYFTAADCREWISKLDSPGLAKKIGQTLKVRSDWDVVKLSIMEWGVREKFSDESLREQLLQTGDEEIIEGNTWHDTYWGQCTCPKCGGKGENYLGKILMKIRNEIKTSTFNIDLL
jgi:ribA/ribD-fused uncharacterized protein